MSIACDGEGNIPVMDIVDGVNTNTSKQEIWVNTVQYEIGNFILNSFDDFYYQCLVSNINSQPAIGNINWKRWSPINYIETDLMKTVGAGGDFETLQEAMSKIEIYQMVGSAKLTLQILSGHVIDYSVFASHKDFGELIIETESGYFEIDVTNADVSKEYALIIFNSISTVTWIGNFNIYGSIPIDLYDGSTSVFNCEGSKINFLSDTITMSTGNATRLNRFINDGLNIVIEPNLEDEVTITSTGFGGFSNDVSGHFINLNISGNMDDIIFWGLKKNSIILENIIVRSSVAVIASVQAREQAAVGIRGISSDFRSSGIEQSIDISVQSGGQITTHNTNSSILGGMNVTPNTVTSNGIIFV